MSRISTFSADDHIDDKANAPIGDLDASYRGEKAQNAVPGSGKIKHVAVRDASGSYTDEEPVNAFMVPSKYLAPDAGRRMAPKRPLGASIASASKTGTPTAKIPKEAVPMYSQVATFGSMPRVRRQRISVPIEDAGDRSWTDQVRHYSHVVFALVVAGALFAWDKAKDLWQSVLGDSRKIWAAVPLLHGKTLYSAYRGSRKKRMGMDDSRFRIVTPAAGLLILLGVVIISGFVGENSWLAPGKKNGAESANTQSGNSILEVKQDSAKSSAANSGNGAAQGGHNSQGGQGGQGGGSPQSGTAAQQAQNAAAAGGVQSATSGALGSSSGGLGSGASTPVSTGVTGGGGGGTSTVPVPATGGVALPSVPATGGGGGTGGGGAPSGGGGGTPNTADCLCEVVKGTLTPITEPVVNSVNNLAPVVSPAPAPSTVKSTVDTTTKSVTGGLPSL